MSELGNDVVVAEKSVVPAIIKGNCLVFGHIFGPGTTVLRASDKKCFTLSGVLSNWRLDGEVTYLAMAADHEQAWIVEETLTTEGGEWDLANEVNANDIADRRATS